MSNIALTLGDQKSCAQTSSKVDNNINVYLSNDQLQPRLRRKSVATSSTKSLKIHGFKPGFKDSSSDIANSDDDIDSLDEEDSLPKLNHESLLNDAEFARKVAACVKEVLLSNNPLALRCCRLHNTILLPFVQYAELIQFIMRKYVNPDITENDITFQLEVATYDMDISCCKLVPHNKEDLNIYKINRIIYNQLDLLTTYSCVFTILNSEFGIESTKLVKI